MTDQITGSMSAITINANQVEESKDGSDHEGLVRHHATCDNCEKPVYGVRHKCLDYPDWDYCSKCVDIAEHIHHRDRFKAIYELLQRSQPAPGTYSSLPTDEGTYWTRLLLLRPGGASDNVECLLSPCDLNTLQYIDKSEKLLPYMAPSYVWGSREDMREIMVNGEPVQVTKNLHEALQALSTSAADLQHGKANCEPTTIANTNRRLRWNWPCQMERMDWINDLLRERTAIYTSEGGTP